MVYEEAPSWKQPSHPDTILVNKGTGDFSQRATAVRAIPAGGLVTPLSSARKAARKTYATVQVSEDSEIDLLCDVLYLNHSCKPSCLIDTTKMEVRVVDDRPLKDGDEMTLFYPSFEWSMDQPFDCYCGEKECIGRISGASDIDPAVLSRYFVNEHIQRQLKRKQGLQNGTNGANGTNGVNGH